MAAPTTPREHRPRPLLRAAGRIGVAMGVAHVVLAPWDTRRLWQDIARDGFWDQVELTPRTPEQHARAEALWISLGSFGVPVLCAGSLMLSSARRDEPLPAWLSALLVAWGGGFSVVMPRSPAWALLGMGLLAAADGRRTPAAGG